MPTKSLYIISVVVSTVTSHGTMVCPEAQPLSSNEHDSDIVKYAATYPDLFDGAMQED